MSLFKWPNVYDIWDTYLKKFIERFQGRRISRARDLFAECLENCPPKFAKRKLAFGNYCITYIRSLRSFDICHHAPLFASVCRFLRSVRRYGIEIRHNEKIDEGLRKGCRSCTTGGKTTGSLAYPFLFHVFVARKNSHYRLRSLFNRCTIRT